MANATESIQQEHENDDSLTSEDIQGLTSVRRLVEMICIERCLAPTPLESEVLNLGEMACLDRCTAKYIQTHRLLSKLATETSPAHAKNDRSFDSNTLKDNN